VSIFKKGAYFYVKNFRNAGFLDKTECIRSRFSACPRKIYEKKENITQERKLK